MNKLIALLSIVSSVLLAMLFTPSLLAEEFHGFGYNDASVTNSDQSYETSNRPATNRGRPAKRFQRLDSDQNGTLSENEVGRPRLFQRMDQNADSVVTLREFRIFQRNRRNAANNQLSANATTSFSNNRSDTNAYSSNPVIYETEGGNYPRNMANQGPRNRRVSAESSAWQSSSYASGEAGTNRGNRTSRFQQLDKDGSGSLSQDELGRPRLFQRMDQNSDGLVTLREFRTFHRNRRQMTAPDSVDTDAPASARGRPAPSNLDNSTDAFPDIEQGDQAQDDDEAIDQPRSRGNPSRRFQKLDVDKNGSLNQEEVGRAKQFQKMDSNADGKVTFTEFINFRNQRQPKTQDSINPDTAIVSPTSPEIANAPQATTDPSAINKYLNIPYNQISGVDPNLLSLDIYAPKNGQQQYPVMVMIHGGSWKSGDKANFYVGPAKAQFFTSIGYVFVSINYRLSPAVKHPAHVQDVATAISWIHNNINKYGGDANNIYLMGHSAGAHLAALVATDEKYLSILGKNLRMLKGAILLDNPAYDLPRAIDELNGGNILKKMYENAFGEDRKVWEDASPAYHIKSNKNIPPFLILFHTSENTIKENLSNEFANKLIKVGILANVIPISGKNHEQMNVDVGKPNDILTVVIFDFLRSVAKLDNTPFRIKDNTALLTSNDSLANLKFTKDYFPGTKDSKDNLMGGTETDSITTHEGKLYAAISYWNWDDKAIQNSGPQILIKRSSNEPWEVDMNLGNDFLRIASLRSILFTTDSNGKKLEPPVPVLLAGVSSKNANGQTIVFVKNNRSGTWKRATITQETSRTALGYSEVRVLFDHTDHASGIHYVFAGIGNTLYRGTYDPQAAELIRWEPNPEMRWSGGRILAAAEANGFIYVTVNIVPNHPGTGGLFKRIDGKSPRWEQVYEWKWSHPNRNHPAPKYGMRGLVKISAGNQEFLLGAREHPGVIERIDAQEKKASLELDVRNLVQQYLMNGKEYLKVTLIAYNDMLPVTNPDTGEHAHLIGLWINPESSDSMIKNSSWYLIRRSDGRYSLGRVFDPNNPNPPSGLRGTRTICKSPFPEDRDRIFYFGGFDATGGPYLNTAWIYKAELLKQTAKSSAQMEK